MGREYPALEQDRLRRDELPTHAFLHTQVVLVKTSCMEGKEMIMTSMVCYKHWPFSPLYIFPPPTALELLPPCALSWCPFSHPWRVESGG